MIPKTERELELYFMLSELARIKAISERRPSFDIPSSTRLEYIQLYKEMKEEYLKLANETE